MRHKTLAVASVVGIAFLTGCGSTSTQGSALAAGSSTAGAVSFAPCTQLTDAMITALGLEPTTKKPYTGKGTTVESGCRWDDAPKMGRLFVDIGVNKTQIDTYLTDLGITMKTELSIGGRRVVNFVTDTAGGGCNLAIDLGEAIAIVATSSTSYVAGVPDPDSCPDAERIATAISPVLQ